jgi:hypothetical protein
MHLQLPSPQVEVLRGESKVFSQPWYFWLLSILGAIGGPKGLYTYFMVQVGDETTAITAGVGKITFRAPWALTLSSVRATLAAASTAGAVTIDVNVNGSTILSTKLTVDQNETTSVTAAIPAVISNVDIADNDVISVDVDGAGANAAGLKITLLGNRGGHG